METQTSVCGKSAPWTAVSRSSVRVILTPLPPPSARQAATGSGCGHSTLGAAEANIGWNRWIASACGLSRRWAALAGACGGAAQEERSRP
jgi:hypothetical protein